MRSCQCCGRFFYENVIFSEVQTLVDVEYWCPECSRLYSWCCDECDCDFADGITMHKMQDNRCLCDKCFNKEH